jgi:hypothetical protein
MALGDQVECVLVPVVHEQRAATEQDDLDDRGGHQDRHRPRNLLERGDPARQQQRRHDERLRPYRPQPCQHVDEWMVRAQKIARRRRFGDLVMYAASQMHGRTSNRPTRLPGTPAPMLLPASSGATPTERGFAKAIHAGRPTTTGQRRFSPTDAHDETSAVIRDNMWAAGSADVRASASPCRDRLGRSPNVA